MAHDFERFPELTLAEAEKEYWFSPHKQIFEDFTARCVKVHDGDTITLSWTLRDFTFPLRLSNLAAPELHDKGGVEARNWLEQRVLGEIVDIKIDPNNKVEKWGRLLGRLNWQGLDISYQEAIETDSVPWERRKDGVIPDFTKQLREMEKQWA